MVYEFDFSPLWPYRWVFLRSLLVSVEISILAIALGTVLGIVLGLGRFYGKENLRLYPFWGFCTVYVYVFLAVPALVLLFWMYYCLPILGIDLGSFWTAVTALAINLSPFACEIFRSGLANLPHGELAAARAMGYTRLQIVCLFILPQFFRNSVPPLLAQYYTTVKLSSLASVIGVYEILSTSQQIINTTYRTIEVYTVVGLLYGLIVIPFAVLAKRYEDRMLIKRI